MDEYKPQTNQQPSVGKAVDYEQKTNIDDYPEFHYG